MHTKFEKDPSKDVHLRGEVKVVGTDGQTDRQTGKNNMPHDHDPGGIKMPKCYMTLYP